MIYLFPLVCFNELIKVNFNVIKCCVIHSTLLQCVQPCYLIHCHTFFDNNNKY